MGRQEETQQARVQGKRMQIDHEYRGPKERLKEITLRPSGLLRGKYLRELAECTLRTRR